MTATPTMTIGIRITDHARHRVRKRLGVPARAVERAATKAWFEGQLIDNASIALRRYVTSLNLKRGSDIRISQGAVFIFDKGTLLTVWPVPKEAMQW